MTENRYLSTAEDGSSAIWVYRDGHAMAVEIRPEDGDPIALDEPSYLGQCLHQMSKALWQKTCAHADMLRRGDGYARPVGDGLMEVRSMYGLSFRDRMYRQQRWPG